MNFDLQLVKGRYANVKMMLIVTASFSAFTGIAGYLYGVYSTTCNHGSTNMAFRFWISDQKKLKEIPEFEPITLSKVLPPSIPLLKIKPRKLLKKNTVQNKFPIKCASCITESKLIGKINMLKPVVRVYNSNGTLKKFERPADEFKNTKIVLKSITGVAKLKPLEDVTPMSKMFANIKTGVKLNPVPNKLAENKFLCRNKLLSEIAKGVSLRKVTDAIVESIEASLRSSRIMSQRRNFSNSSNAQRASCRNNSGDQSVVAQTDEIIQIEDLFESALSENNEIAEFLFNETCAFVKDVTILRDTRDFKFV